MRQVRTPGSAAALVAVLLLANYMQLPAANADEGTAAEVPAEDSSGESRHILQVGGHGTPRQPVDVDRIVRVLQKGTSSREAREQALSRLPLSQLSETDRAKASAVLEDASLFREMPSISIPVDHTVFRYFSHRPDVAVSIWRAMEISKLDMKQVGASDYVADAGDGTSGDIHFVWRSENSALVLCDGVYSNALLLRPIRAQCLLHIESSLSKRKSGEPYAAHRAALFVAFPSQSVGTVARIVSPVSNRLLDRNVREISAFLHLMSTAMENQPGFIERLAERMEGLPEGRQEEFLRVAARAYVDRQRREATAAGEPASLPELPLTTADQSTAPLR